MSYTYVDNRHPNAQDSRDHGSIDRPWKTLKYAFRQLRPGDTLFIRQGVYKNDSIWLTDQNSGKKSAPITVKVYVDENVILRKGSSIILEGTEWWTFEALQFDQFSTRAFEIGQHQTLPGQTVTAAARHITIRDCEIKNSSRSGINIYYGYDISIEDCYFHNIRPGVSFKKKEREASGVDVLYKGGNISIIGSRFEDIGSDGIHLGAWSYRRGSEIGKVDIIDNEFWVNRPYRGILSNVGENGIDIKKVQGPILISGSSFHGFRPVTADQDASGADGDALVIHNDARKITVEKNLFFDNTTHILLLKGRVASGPLRNIVIRNNIFQKAHRGINKRGKHVGGYALSIEDTVNIQVYHNTFYDNEIYLKSANLQTGFFKNNVIYKGKAKVNGSTSQWEAATNAWSQVDNTIPSILKSSTDLQLTDLKLDSSLQPLSDSPLLQKGQQLKVLEDLKGNRRSDGKPDLGAIECISTNNGNNTDEKLIFVNKFKARDLDDWSIIMGEEGVSIQARAARFTGRGLEIHINGDQPRRLERGRLPKVSQVYAQFSFNPNSLKMGHGHSFHLAQFRSRVNLIRVELNYDGETYGLGLGARLDINDEWVYSEWSPISDEWHTVEFGFKAASDRNTNDGEAKLWIDENLVASLPNLSNHRRATKMQLGALWGIHPETTGSIYFDEVKIGRRYIGFEKDKEIDKPLKEITAELDTLEEAVLKLQKSHSELTTQIAELREIYADVLQPIIEIMLDTKISSTRISLDKLMQVQNKLQLVEQEEDEMESRSH